MFCLRYRAVFYSFFCRIKCTDYVSWSVFNNFVDCRHI
jgi:hypothetical protein